MRTDPKQPTLPLTGETTTYVPPARTGGELYSTLAIQPAEFNELNQIPFCMASAIKHICLHHVTGEKQNLLRAIHYCEMGMAIYETTKKSWAAHLSRTEWVVTPETFSKENMFSKDIRLAVAYLCTVFTQGSQGYLSCKSELERIVRDDYV